MKINNKEKFIKHDCKVTILGTDYSIIYRDYNDYQDFKRLSAAGFCDMTSKIICICNIESDPDYTKLANENLEEAYKETLRHEIVHAFLYESGLDGESHNSNNGWATDEEIVDWIAIQAPKLFNIFSSLNIL